MIISEINIYPVKSLKGIALQDAVVESRGLRFDRRWMLTDPDGMFFTQREVPKMATISVEVNSSGLVVGAPYAEPMPIRAGSRSDTVKTQKVTVWGSICDAAIFPKEVNEWFSTVLEHKCQLVAMPETTNRLIDPEYAVTPDENIVSFADGYPFLLIGEGSLADLNSRLDAPVPMNRFRPNFVVAGSEAFAEDNWKRVRIGETVFHVVKPCARCVITTVDQSTGKKNGKEPLKTLSAYRNSGGKVLFGQNLIAANPGEVVRIGDKIEILDA